MPVALERLMSDPRRSALLIIDMQIDFLLAGASVPAPGGLELVPTIAALAREARRTDLPVVFTQEMHRADHSDFGIELAFEPPHCIEGTPGMDLVAGLEPRRARLHRASLRLLRHPGGGRPGLRLASRRPRQLVEVLAPSPAPAAPV